MEKIEFCKIFELENYQILIMKDEDEDEYVVKQITDFPGFRPMMSLGFATEEKRDECFNDYTEENAKNSLRI